MFNKLMLSLICFLVMVGFTIGLYLGLTNHSWNPDSKVNGFAVFFGFGIPLCLAGFGSVALSSNDKELLAIFGWVYVVIGLIWTATLFYLMAGWAGVVAPSAKTGFAVGFGQFLGFGIPAFCFSCLGIILLVDPPGKSN